MGKKVALLILDGWGYGNKDKSDVIYNSDTPNFNQLISKYANASLLTHGENVGLPDGQMGNSEVGHLNIGAGRIVYQELTRINKAIKDKEIEENQAFKNSINHAIKNNTALHLIGLVSKGGVHSSQDHLYELVNIASNKGVKDIFIHAFTDGRDCDPKSGIHFISELEDKIKNTNAKIASVIGRYFAMDRDNRWERVAKAYHLLTDGQGEKNTSVIKAIEKSYQNNITDEFIEPTVMVDENDNPLGLIKDNDAVLCFNFRTDRCREISTVLTQEAFHEYNMHPLNIHYTTMTEYDKSFKNVHVIFTNDNLKNTIGEVIQNNNLKQIRIAETEKYPHVTFFFSGGREKEFNGERRLLQNSPKVATYDLMPEMSAYKIKDAIIPEIQNKSVDFICLNFANPDMVGHTGVYDAIKKAVETVDECVGEIIEEGLKNDYSFIIIADHGNADFALNDDGTPNTAHSTNPVPVIIVDKNVKEVKDGILADVAPTILKLMNIEQPVEMTGKSLI